jgi:DNA-binding Xre family transcriptional regulator|tara:strand:- start:290 stop:448 length:159 start_codon:yes stop_codon:yes gene_type:complete
MIKEISIIVLGCLIMGLFLWRQDKKKKEEELSNRLYIAENNITYLKNRLHKK